MGGFFHKSMQTSLGTWDNILSVKMVLYGKIISYMKKLKKKARKNKSKNIKPKVELGLQYHDVLQKIREKTKKELLKKKKMKEKK